MTINKKQYPYEIYCTNCARVVLYTAKQLGPGEKIKVEHALHIGGRKLTPSDKLKCACTGKTNFMWQQRRRYE